MTERARSMSAGLRWMRFEDPDVILEYIESLITDDGQYLWKFMMVISIRGGLNIENKTLLV